MLWARRLPLAYLFEPAKAGNIKDAATALLRPKEVPMLKMLCLLAVPCAALCGPGLADTIYVDDDASWPDAHINRRRRAGLG